MMNKVDGILTKEEARIIQLQKYEQDKIKHAEKEKEKLEKKKAEKWKRYKHIDMGEKLPNTGLPEYAARNTQKSVHDEKIMNYVLKLERENARLRAEENRNESSPAAACSNTTFNMQSPRSPVGRIPFEVNPVTNSHSLRSQNVSSPTSSISRELFEENSANVEIQNSSTVNVCDSPTTRDKAELEKMKQEKYKREMEIVRQNMQKLYSQQITKDD